MGSSRKRSLDRSNDRPVDLSETPKSAKKLKTASISSPSSEKSLKNSPIPEADYQAPKSKKELRALKKAARKSKEVEKNVEAINDAGDKVLSKEEYKQQKQLEKKEQRKAMMQELRKQERESKKVRQKKKHNRDSNAPKWKQVQAEATNETRHQQQSEKKTKKKATKTGPDQEEQDIAMKALKQVLRGTTDESGMTTATLGVKYKDIVDGTGDEVREKKLVTVQYQLKGGKFKAILDSSKKFNFRVGKGEVIQGWDM
jgi:FKBP-type peptidyl-prolyl cis-trans isomerase